MLFVVDVLKVIVFAHRCSWRLCASLLFLRQYSEASNLKTWTKLLILN